MSSCGGGFARRRSDHDSVDKLAEFDKPIHWQPRISYNFCQAGLARHPGRKNERRSVFSPHEHMFDAAVLIPAGQNKGLPSQRMKRIRNCDFLRRNPGTMSPLRTKAADAPPPYAHRSRQAQQHRSACLARRRARAPARSSGETHPRVPALELESPGSRRSGLTAPHPRRPALPEALTGRVRPTHPVLWDDKTAARAGDQATISKHISETTRSRCAPGGGMR